MKAIVYSVLALALSPGGALRAASSSSYSSSNSNWWGDPSIPPAATRQPLSARVLPSGVGRSGITIDQLRAGAQDQHYQYPLDHDGRTGGGGAFTTWGLPPGGLELGGGFVYPFFVPYFQLRVQLLGRDWEYGPFVTLEGGASAIPDFFGGLVLGAGLGQQYDLAAAYRRGRHLDRDYGEWGAVLTVRATDFMDLGVGAAYRQWEGGPRSGDMLRISLLLGFGNPPRASYQQLAKIEKGGQDPYKLYETGEYEAAAIVFKDEISYQPREPRLWQWYGHALRKSGQVREARRAFAKARSLIRSQKEEEVEREMERDNYDIEKEPLPEKILP